VLGAVGHSKAASVVLMHAATLSRIDKWGVVCLSGRFDMRETPAGRFSQPQLDALAQTGRFVWKQYTANGVTKDYLVTADDLRIRDAIDMRAVVAQVAIHVSDGRIRVLMLHGDADTVVPCKDMADYSDTFKEYGATISTVLVPGMDHFFKQPSDIISLTAHSITDFFHP
jgi:hypothetical protein